MASLEQAFIRAVGKASDQRGKPAVLGKLDGTLYWVDPSGMTHRTRVWARIGEQNSNQLVVVDCLKVPPQIDMPVRVDYVNGVLSVVDVDNKRAVEFGGGRPPGSGGAHAWMHSRLGPDPVYIEGLQYLPLAVTPNVPTPDLTVLVQPGAYYDLSGDLQVIDTAVASGSTSAYVPGSGNHFVIICLDRSDGSIVIVDGDDVSGGGDALFPTASVTAADIEAITIDPDYWPLGVVLLAAGQTQIKAKDIVRDLRPVAGSGGGGGTPGGADTQVQFNDGGVFGGDANFTWNGADGQLLIGGSTAVSSTDYVVEFHDTGLDTLIALVNDSDSDSGNITGFNFFQKNASGIQKNFGAFAVGPVDLTNGSEDGYFVISTMFAGTSTPLARFEPDAIYLNYLANNTDTIIRGDTATNLLVIDAGLDAVQIGTTVAGAIADFRSTAIVFNNAEADIDIRWAGSGVTNGYLYDAGNNRHGFGTATPQRTMHIIGVDGPVSSFPASFSAKNHLIVENNGNAHIGMVAGANGVTHIRFYEDGQSSVQGWIEYSHATDIFSLIAGATTQVLVGNGMRVGTVSGGAPGLGAIGIGSHINIDEISSTPTTPTLNAAANIYVKGDKLIIQFNNAGTVRYKYLDLTGTGVTWVHTTTAP